MKKRALHKDFFMEIKKSYNRFLSIFFIVAMGVAFYSGIQSAAPDMRLTGDSYFDNSNLMDLKVLGTLGLDDSNIEAISQVNGVKKAEPGYMTDVLCRLEDDEKVLHIESLVPTMNQLTVAEGKLPENPGECFLDEEFMENYGYQVGDTVGFREETDADKALKEEKFEIVGKGSSPAYISFSKGNSSLGSGEVSGYGFVIPDDFEQDAYAFAYVEAEGARELTAYTQEYDDLVERLNHAVEGIETVQCENRYEQVQKEADEKLSDARLELADGREESTKKLSDAKQELDDGEIKLSDGKQKLLDSKRELEDNEKLLGEKESELQNAREEIASGEAALKKGKAELDEKESEYLQKLPGLKEQFAAGEKALADAKVQLESGESQYAQGKAQYDDGYAKYTAGKKQYEDGMDAWKTGTKALKAASVQYRDGKKQLENAKKQYSSGLKELEEGRKQYEAGKGQLSQAKLQYDQGAASVAEYDKGRTELANARASYKAGMTGLAQAKAEYSAGQKTLTDAKVVYDGKKAEYESGLSAYEQEMQEFYGAQERYEAGVAEYQQGQSQYDQEAARIEQEEGILGELLELIDAGKATPDQIAQADQLTAQLPVWKQALAEAGAALESEKAQLASANEELQAKESILQGTKQQLEEANQALAQGLQEIQAKEQQLSEAGTKIAENEKALSDASVSIAENQKKLDAAGPQIEAVRAKLPDAKKVIDANEKKLALSGEGIQSNEKKLQLAKKQIDANEKKLKDAAHQINKNTKKLNAAKKELDARAPELKAAKVTLDASALKLTNSRKTLDENKVLLTSKESELNTGKSQLSQADTQISKAKSEIASNEQKLKDASKQADDGQIQLQEGKEKLEDGKKEIKKAEKTIEKNEKKLEDGRKEYEDGKEEAGEKITDGEQKIADAEQKIAELKMPEWVIQDRSALPENTGYGENADRITNIGQVFPVLFFLVAALISLTTMTRMVEEQRTQIGTMKALGYSKLSIASKYINYALLATLGGSLFGILVGEKVLPYIIVNAYGIMYHHMSDILLPYNLKFGVMSAGAALVCTLGATIAACYAELAATPAALMRPPAPKEGKRVLLERITFVWKHLSFTWKSTIRNLFRYKKRFLMTIFGIGGCMALLLVGFGLRDSVMDIALLQYNEIQLYDGMVIEDSDASDTKREELRQEIVENSGVQASVGVVMKKDSVQVGKKSMGLYLCVPETTDDFQEFVNFRNRKTKQRVELEDQGVILTEKIADMLNVGPGDKFTLIDEEKGNVEVPVAAVSENYMTHYVYMTPALYEKLYGEKPDFNTTLFKVSEGEKKSVESVGQSILENKTALGISYTSSIKGQLDDMLGSLDIVIVLLIVSAGMLAFVVLYNLNNININERKRELATIKVLGFYDNEVSAYVYRENILLTIFGVLLGIVLGILLHRITIVTVEVDACMFGRSIKGFSYLYSVLFTIGFSLVVNVVMYFKLKKIDMVESLKSVE